MVSHCSANNSRKCISKGDHWVQRNQPPPNCCKSPTWVAASMLLWPFAAAQSSLLVACHPPRPARHHSISPHLDASGVLIRGIALFFYSSFPPLVHHTMPVQDFRCSSCQSADNMYCVTRHTAPRLQLLQGNLVVSCILIVSSHQKIWARLPVREEAGNCLCIH
jgi:hypothetical protein